MFSLIDNLSNIQTFKHFLFDLHPLHLSRISGSIPPNYSQTFPSSIQRPYLWLSNHIQVFGSSVADYTIASYFYFVAANGNPTRCSPNHTTIRSMTCSTNTSTWRLVPLMEKIRRCPILISFSHLTRYRVTVAIYHPLSPLPNAINHRNPGVMTGPCRMTGPLSITLLSMTPSTLLQSQMST